MTDSASPRLPPIASSSEKSSPRMALMPRLGGVASLTGTRLELVTRVEHRRAPVRHADEPADPEPATRFDPDDLPTSEPHEVERSRSVEQGGFERQHTLSGPQGDAVQHARDHRAPPSRGISAILGEDFS